MNDFTETINDKRFKRTEVMCSICIGERVIDLGNYYVNSIGERVLITTAALANQYADLISVPVYVLKRDQADGE